MDTVVGADPAKIDQLIQTALMIETTANDATIMQKVLDEAQKLIEANNFKNAEMILRDGFTYEQWRDLYGAKLLIGVAWCQLKGEQDAIAARKTLEPLTQAQIETVEETSYWGQLMFEVDAEIQRLEEHAQPDEAEDTLRKQVSADQGNLDLQMSLAQPVFDKNRHEDCIPILLDMIVIDRNWNEKAHIKLLNQVFAKLGAAHDATKAGRRKLGNILF